MLVILLVCVLLVHTVLEAFTFTVRWILAGFEATSPASQLARLQTPAHPATASTLFFLCSGDILVRQARSFTSYFFSTS
jgi:hypothetical protein